MGLHDGAISWRAAVIAAGLQRRVQACDIEPETIKPLVAELLNTETLEWYQSCHQNLSMTINKRFSQNVKLFFHTTHCCMNASVNRKEVAWLKQRL